ncbi:Hypothetical_protein [Hexamita inflata]|uniref:Hypothetical_protein n=1 Tax=Hexamita inflata TaxID=28002 RepID=A0AA86V8Y8_9EUKA|nr:Hypothetical protein HINF_LOCUS47343 [Hexamita inflata]
MLFRKEVGVQFIFFKKYKKIQTIQKTTHCVQSTKRKFQIIAVKIATKNNRSYKVSLTTQIPQKWNNSITVQSQYILLTTRFVPSENSIIATFSIYFTSVHRPRIQLKIIFRLINRKDLSSIGCFSPNMYFPLMHFRNLLHSYIQVKRDYFNFLLYLHGVECSQLLMSFSLLKWH